LRQTKAPLLVSSKSPTPIAASRWKTPSKQSDNQKKDYGTNGGNNDRADQPATNVNAQLGQEPCANEGTNNPDCNIGNETKSAARPSFPANQPATRPTSSMMSRPWPEMYIVASLDRRNNFELADRIVDLPLT